MLSRIIFSTLFLMGLNLCHANIYCPSDKTLYCHDDIHYLPLTGTPIVFGYPTSAAKYIDTKFLNQCNVGYVDRKWYLDLNSDNVHQPTESSCIQRITLLADPGNILINYPADKTYGCKEDIKKEMPTWINGPCDVLGSSVTEQVFDVASDACYKIFRNFTIINWCTYKPQEPNWDGSGIWTHTQVIKVIETTPPVIKDCTDKVIGLESDCMAPFTIKNSAVDVGICGTELLSWVVEIDLWANGDVDYKYGFNESGDFKLNPVANGKEISITLPERVQIGRHKIKWSVRDECGNFASCHTIVETKDLKKPTPYMHEFLTAAFQGSVMDFIVSPRLFNVGSFDNCTPSSKLRYSFSSSVNDTIRVINCSNAGFQFFTIYVTDLAGNQEYVEAFMVVFDNGACSMTATFQGTVTESNGAVMQHVSMSLVRLGQEDKYAMSNVQGKFGWENISLYNDYKVIPKYEQVEPSRVDIADLKKLQNYLFGIDTLVNFEYMAADLNRDNKIRINDLNMLRENILKPGYNNQKMWRFAVDATDIKSVSELSKIKEVFDIMEFDGSIDFTAVYSGDITGANKKETSWRSTTPVTESIKDSEYQLFANDVIVAEGVELEFKVNPSIMDELTIASPYFDVTGSTVVKNKETGVIKILVLKDFETKVSTPFITISNKISGLKISDIQRQNTSKVLLKGYQTVYLRDNKSSNDAGVWSVTPNPSNSGKFVLESTNIIDRVNVRDIHGRDVSFDREDINISINALPGVYLITILSDGKYSTKKVLIAK